MSRLRRLLVMACGLGAVGWSHEIAADPGESVDLHHETEHAVRHRHGRPPVHGWDFPDGVVALTWDDGPDVRTVELARYLRSRRVSGTFFVVRDWSEAEEAGEGNEKYRTGYAHLPVLGELVALGHRLGNHTDGHVMLSDVSPASVVAQLGRGQAAIDPFLKNELRMFRAPGGYWSEAASEAIDVPSFASTVGPIHWDVDRKDWEGSLWCRSDEPWRECERSPTADPVRVKATVIAARYAAAVDRARRGIVLLHDRVGDVGSRYAIDIARSLVPALEARGYVFAPPVLGFTAFENRSAAQDRSPSLDEGSVRLADVDGDGLADMCGARHGRLFCGRSVAGARPEGAMPRTSFTRFAPVPRLPPSARGLAMADIDGDGGADLCVLTDREIACVRRTTRGGFGPAESWSVALGARGEAGALLRLGDVDGDGRADACVRGGDGVLCAASTGTSFAGARTWIDASAALDPTRFELADVDGDGRADACSDAVCALSTGRAFGAPSTWSTARELGQAEETRFGDLNGDGRADVCALGPEAVACAFSTGRAFTAPTPWLTTSVASIELGDLNGDGRADLCAVVAGEVRCGLAP